ncbi:protein sidekick-like isoform X2 [Rhagoletis pomonella]|uniref:protein sidekick-like isoform X2 n=1 Tax=Rhagoletis pomonella TaxID=28610 RepID=UPI001786C3D9|nr:protein sidekick-like isoform X2 [Rhagoletis pomonella]
MEECERRLQKSKFVLFHNNNNNSGSSYYNCHYEVPSKFNLWITFGVWLLLSLIGSCYCSGYPQPTYRWLKDGIPIGDFSSSQYYRLQKTRREDAGSYQCIAKNDAGSIFSEKIDIEVAYMGIFENTTLGHLTVTSGHPAIFDLPTIESQPSPSVMWQTVEGPLNYDIKYAVTKSNQLIILSADEDDRKAYRARAINTQLGKEENSAFIQLNVSGDPYVEVAPEIVVHPQDMKVKRGEQVAVLECIANARPLHELETLWLKDGIPIESAGVAHTLNDPWNRSLSLLSVNLTHSGEYTCQVRLRSGGYDTVTVSAKVEVLEPPTFFTQMRTETFGEFGALVTLTCDVVGDPMPVVKWYKNAEPIEANDGKYTFQEDNSLIIKKLTLEDGAMFQCLASNEAGERSAYTWLRVKCLPPKTPTPTTTITHTKHIELRMTTANNNRPNAIPLHFVEKRKSSSSSSSSSQGYVRSLLHRFKRLAQPRILRVRASSTHSGMGTGYRRKDFRFGMGYLS